MHEAVRCLSNVTESQSLSRDCEAAWSQWVASDDGGVGQHRRRRAQLLMRRGDVRLVDLDPTRGSEQGKKRPCIVVSNDHANRTAGQLGRGVVTVVPVISNVATVYPFQVPLTATGTGLPRDTNAQAEQVRSVDVRRVGALVGDLDVAALAAVDHALPVHLAL